MKKRKQIKQKEFIWIFCFPSKLNGNNCYDFIFNTKKKIKQKSQQLKGPLHTQQPTENKNSATNDEREETMFPLFFWFTLNLDKAKYKKQKHTFEKTKQKNKIITQWHFLFYWFQQAKWFVHLIQFVIIIFFLPQNV